MSRRVVGLIAVLCLAFAAAAPVASARTSSHHYKKVNRHYKQVVRKQLLRSIHKNPRLIRSKSFLKKASLVNFKLPITVRLRGSSAVSNPNVAKIDLGTSLGQRQIGLGGSLSGEITFHDSFDGGALGNVDLTLNPGTKTLTSTSIPLLWNTDISDPLSSIAPAFNLGAGTVGCGNFHGNSPVNVGGNFTVPYWNTQADFDNNQPPAGYVPDTPGVDDPARLTASPAVGNPDNLGPSATPFPYSAQSDPGNFGQPPSPADSVFRTAPLSLGIAVPGTEVDQSDGSTNGPQGSQNLVIGQSGGQANLFGNIPGKNYGIDVSVSLATRINSILRSQDPDYVPLIATNPWPATWSQCRQAYTGAVQNYIPGVHLRGTLKIAPAITSDGKLRIAKATLTQLDPSAPTRISLAACLYPYSLYSAENNNSDTVSQTVSNYTTGGQLPTDEFVARSAPTNVNCNAPATKLVQDAPTLALAAASAANGYTVTNDGSRVSVAGDLSVTNISADILIGDVDAPPAGSSAGAHYLALGDSLAYGYEAALFQATPNPAVFNFGYADLFATHMGKTLTNYGCPGETTDSFISGGPAPGTCAHLPSPFPYSLLHATYSPSTNQLAAAEAFLDGNPTGEITLDIGANDLLVFLQGTCGFPSSPTAGTCIANGFAGMESHIDGNVKTILDGIRAHAPNADVTVMGLYNPYPNLLSVGGHGGDFLTAQLNAGIHTLATQHSAHFVDPLPVFNPSGAAGGSEAGDIPVICSLTLQCPGGVPFASGADIHPTKKGYQALASLFESATGL
jgi:lysophospholipase L1-like esterase